MLSSFLCPSSLSQNLPERLLAWAMMFVEKDFHTPLPTVWLYFSDKTEMTSEAAEQCSAVATAKIRPSFKLRPVEQLVATPNRAIVASAEHSSEPQNLLNFKLSLKSSPALRTLGWPCRCRVHQHPGVRVGSSLCLQVQAGVIEVAGVPSLHAKSLTILNQMLRHAGLHFSKLAELCSARFRWGCSNKLRSPAKVNGWRVSLFWEDHPETIEFR